MEERALGSIGDTPHDTPVDSCEMCIDMCIRSTKQGFSEEIDIQAATTYRGELSVCEQCAEVYDKSVAQLQQNRRLRLT